MSKRNTHDLNDLPIAEMQCGQDDGLVVRPRTIEVFDSLDGDAPSGP